MKIRLITKDGQEREFSRVVNVGHAESKLNKLLIVIIAESVSLTNHHVYGTFETNCDSVADIKFLEMEPGLFYK